MYSYTPEANRKTGLALSFSCFIPSMMLLLIKTNVTFYRSVLFCASILLFTVGACVFFRFVMTSFTYRIESNYGSEDLVIFCTTGKRVRTVLRVSFDSLTELCPCGNKKDKKKRGKTKNYFYCADIFGKGRYFLYLYDDFELCRIRFCPDETIVRAIETAVKRNQLKNLT